MKSFCVVRRSSVVLGLLGASALFLAGCASLDMTATSGPAMVPVEGAALRGSVMGGNQPISGAVIQLYAAGTTGYGSAAEPLIPTADQVVFSTVGTSGALTNSSGGFEITGDYTCPSASSQVYITATGGNPGLTGTVNNTEVSLVAALGSCGNLSSSTTIQINELTTVAAVWALQQFIGVVPGTTLATQPGVPGGTTQTPAFSIGSSSTNVQGMANAFLWANYLVPYSTGASATAAASTFTSTVTGSNATYAPEYWQLNLLGNILSSCVNTNQSSSTGCSTLFSDTAMLSGQAPADTLQAAYAIATNPVYNVSALFGLESAQATFAPVPPIVPNDFTVLVTTTPAFKSNLYLNTSMDIAFDSYGNAWISSTCHGAGAGSAPGTCNSNGGITSGPDFQPIIAETDALGNPIGIAITSYNTGTATSPTIATIQTPYIATSGTSPMPIAIDTNNNVWATDFQGGYIFSIPGSGSAGGLNGTLSGVAASVTGSITAVSLSSGLITFTATNTGSLTPGQEIILSGFTSSNAYLNGEAFVVVSATSTTFSVWELKNATPTISGTPTYTAYTPNWNKNLAISTGANSYPYSLTVDGNNTVWFATGTGYSDAVAISPWASGDTFPTAATRAYGGFTTSNGTPGSGFYVNIAPGYYDTTQMAVDMTPSSTYPGAPFLYANDAGTNTYGIAYQIFTNGGSDGTTTITQGTKTQLGGFTANGSTATGVVKIADTTTATFGSTTGIDAYAMDHGYQMLVDGYNNLWVLNDGTADSASTNYPKYSLSKITPSTYSANASGALQESAAPTVQVYTSTAFQVGATAYYTASNNGYIALDGANNIWMVVTGTSPTGIASTMSVLEFNNSGTELSATSTTSSNGFVGATNASQTTTYDRSSGHAPRSVAIDLSGNVWMTTTSTGSDTLFMLIGQAAPPVLPISLALKNGTLGQRP